MSDAAGADEFGVYWAAGVAEYSVTMSDGSVRRVAVPLGHDSKQKAMAKAERDAQQEARRVSAHVIDPGSIGPYDTCAKCGEPIREDACGRGLVTMITGNPECYGKRGPR